MKHLTIILLCLFTNIFVFSQTMPPLPVNTNNSSGDNHDPECKKLPPIIDNKTVSLSIENSHPGGAIAIVDIDIEVENLIQNQIIAIEYDDDGLMFGYPKWDLGSHQITIGFNDFVRSNQPDATFIVTAKILYYSSKGGHIKEYIYSICVNDPTAPIDGQGGKKFGVDTNQISISKSFEKLDVYMNNTFEPSLILNVENGETPITIYLVSLSRPGDINIIRNNKLHNIGENIIQFPEVPNGIYEVVVQQGNKVGKAKFVNFN